MHSTTFKTSKIEIMLIDRKLTGFRKKFVVEFTGYHSQIIVCSTYL